MFSLPSSFRLFLALKNKKILTNTPAWFCLFFKGLPLHPDKILYSNSMHTTNNQITYLLDLACSLTFLLNHL